MYDRIRDCLCHPRYLGLYYKDKIGKIIGFVISFVLIFLGVTALYVFGNVNFSYNDAKNATSHIQLGEDSNISFDSKTGILSGDEMVYESTSMCIYFLSDNEVAVNTIIALKFEADHVSVYFGSNEVKNINYRDLNVTSFSVLGVKYGNLNDVVAFQDFIDRIFDVAESNYLTIYYIDFVIRTLIYYVIIFVIALIASRFYNPTIEMKVRSKLVLYSTIIFIFGATIAIMFQEEWVLILGAFLALIYTRITFSHIVRRKIGDA